MNDPESWWLSLPVSTGSEAPRFDPGQCPAALILKGEHFQCQAIRGHGLPHGNSEAEAVWGGDTSEPRETY